MICSLKVALKYVISVLSKLHESVLIRLQSGPTGCALAKKEGESPFSFLQDVRDVRVNAPDNIPAR